MRLKYTANTTLSNMPVAKRYFLNSADIKANSNKIAKYFINQRKKNADLRLIVDYDDDDANYLHILLVDWQNLALWSQSGWLAGCFSDNAMTVYKPKNIEKILISFANKRVKNGVAF